MTEIVLTNGKIITVDSAFSIAEAIAIEGERIRAVGRSGDLHALIGPRTRVIDLAGKAVVPGLIDGHAHLDREGLKSVYPSLGRVRSFKHSQARIAELARLAAPGEWIIVMPIGDPPAYFDVPGILEEKRYPNRYELDEAAPDNPVYIRAIWGFWRHTLPIVSIANSRALEIAGVDRNTAPPAPMVTIEKDRAGEPTGVFYENTFMPIVELTLMRCAPGFTRADRARALPISCRAYNRFGTTSIFEEHGAATELVRAYKDALQRNDLTVRAALVMSPNWRALPRELPLAPFIEAWCGALGEPALGNDFLKLTGILADISYAADNAARSIALPYTGWAGFNYDTALPRERAKELLIACAENDVRAVGIWPNAIDLFYEIHRMVPLNGRRWVYGHIATLTPQDIDRIEEMGLVLTSHTNRHIYKEGHLHQERIGAERETEISPLRTLIERGLRGSLATDNVPVSLFFPIWQSVARRSRYTRKVIAPSECLTREQALRAATINGAWLTFDEKRKGSLEPGKLADLAVLDADPLTVEEDRLKTIAAELTMVGGRIVYQRAPGEDPAAELDGL
ncbi:MAG: amidohydrolase [Betaproteobacteria bacterium]|nr:amidohydrolase [Betaproteobacteria bacterium]